MIVHNISIMQWMYVIFISLLPLWVIGILCCTIGITHEIRNHAKKHRKVTESNGNL
jgi:hypothetical protein